MQSDTEKTVKNYAAKAAAKAKTAAKWLWDLTGIFPYVRLGLVAVVIGVVIYMTQCGTSKNEEHLEQQTNLTVEKTAEEKVAEDKADRLTVDAKKADQSVAEAQRAAKPKIKEAKEARNANIRGTSYEEANRERCATYPESKECNR